MVRLIDSKDWEWYNGQKWKHIEASEGWNHDFCLEEW